MKYLKNVMDKVYNGWSASAAEMNIKGIRLENRLLLTETAHDVTVTIWLEYLKFGSESGSVTSKL